MKRRTKSRAQKAAAKRSRIANPGGSSRYALKAAWLLRSGVWGFEVPFPKPWK